MTRTCSALIDLAFDELRLNRIEISCAVENRRCRMVPERLGFKQEGVSRQRERLHDHFVDTVTYGMLASDWKNRTVLGLDPDVVLTRFSAQNKSLLRIPTN